MPNYDDPVIDEAWCSERRFQVAAYLKREGVDHGRIGDWPAWHVCPYVSIWAIESKLQPEWVGWWVICGDMPTDYVSAGPIRHPRDAMKAIAKRWHAQAELMERGETLPDLRIGSSEDGRTLAKLLTARAGMLHMWATEDSMWETDDSDEDGAG